MAGQNIIRQRRRKNGLLASVVLKYAFPVPVGFAPMATSSPPGYCHPVKITNLRCLITAGVAVLFLGLSGSVRATSFSTPDVWKAGVRFSDNYNEPGGRVVAPSPERMSLYERFSSPTFFHGTEWGITRRSGEIHDHNGSNPPTESASPTLVTVGDSAAQVPDGGSTAIMMSAALVGLAFLRKRLKAGSGLSAI